MICSEKQTRSPCGQQTWTDKLSGSGCRGRWAEVIGNDRKISRQRASRELEGQRQKS